MEQIFKLILFGGNDKLRPGVPCVILGSVFLLFIRCVWTGKETRSTGSNLITRKVNRGVAQRGSPKSHNAKADIQKLQSLLTKINGVKDQFCLCIYRDDCDSVNQEFLSVTKRIESAIRSLRNLAEAPYTTRCHGTVANLLKKEDLSTVKLAKKHFFEKSLLEIQKLQKSAQAKGLRLYNAASTAAEKKEVATRFAPFFEDVLFGEENTYLFVAHARRLKGLLDGADNKLDEVQKEPSKAFVRAFLFLEYGLVEKKIKGSKDPVLEYAHRIVAQTEKRPEGIAPLQLPTYRMGVYAHMNKKNQNSRIGREELEAISERDHLSFDLYRICSETSAVVQQPIYSLLGPDKIPIVEYPDGTLEMLEQIIVRPQHQPLSPKTYSDLFKVRKRARDLIAEIRKKIQDKFNSLKDKGEQFAYAQRVFDQIKEVDNISSELDQGNKSLAHIQGLVKTLEECLKANEKNVKTVAPNNLSQNLQVACVVLSIERFITAIDKQVENSKDLECAILLERKEELQGLIKNLKANGFTQEIQSRLHTVSQEETTFNNNFEAWIKSQLKQLLEKYGDELWDGLRDFYRQEYGESIETTEMEMQLIRDMSSVWNSFFEEEFVLCPKNFEDHKKRFDELVKQCMNGSVNAKEDDFELLLELKYNLAITEDRLSFYFNGTSLKIHFEQNKDAFHAPLLVLKEEASKEKTPMFTSQKLLPASLTKIDENILSICYQNTLDSSTVTTTVMDYIVRAHSEQKRVMLFTVDYETKLLKKMQFFKNEFPDAEVLNLFHTLNGRIQVLL